MRSFRTNARIRSLTTGTFNRVVKDRIADRLSGANSVQANPHKCESDCPRNLTNIRCRARPCQRKRFTEFPPDFHSGETRPGGQRSRHQGRKPRLAHPRRRGWKPHPFKSGDAQRYGLPPGTAPELRRRPFRPCEGGRQKIEKRTKLLEVLALKVPFRNLLLFPNQAPWPGRLREFHPLNH